MSIECDSPRHGKRGTGAHYADRIKQLGNMHKLALDVMQIHDVRNYETGMGLTSLWKLVRQHAINTDQPIPTKQGLSGRLSELQGLGMVRSENNQIRLVDSASQQFRFEKSPRWFLSNSSP
jgi:hypothetical protein